MMQKKTILILLISIFILAGTGINAVGFFGFGDSVSWKEEVLLHDGQKIIVKRWQKYGGNHEIGQKPPIKEQSLKFTIPGTSKEITWKDEYSEDVHRANFKLVALHILNGTPYIITKPYLCLSYNKWGRPNPPYIIFKYKNEAWKRIQLADLPVEFKDINLVIATMSDEQELLRQGMVSAENVKKLNKSLTQSEFKTIVREPIKDVDNEAWCSSCIYVGNGNWYEKRKFTSMKSYEECVKFCTKKDISAEYCPCNKLFNNK